MKEISEKEKIINIIAAPPGMSAQFVSNNKAQRVRVACLALVENEEGAREVKPMAVYNGSDFRIIPEKVCLVL